METLERVKEVISCFEVNNARGNTIRDILEKFLIEYSATRSEEEAKSLLETKVKDCELNYGKHLNKIDYSVNESLAWSYNTLYNNLENGRDYRQPLD